MYQVLVEYECGPVTVDWSTEADEAYLTACNLQAEGHKAWVEETLDE